VVRDIFSDFSKLDCANATVLGRRLIIDQSFISLSVKTETHLRNVCCILRQFGFRKKLHVFQPTCLTATLPQKLDINKGSAAKHKSDQERFFIVLCRKNICKILTITQMHYLGML